MYAKNRSVLLALACALAFAILALPSRIEQLQRPFWLDESSHNRLILESSGLLDLRQKIDYLFQPVLEFSLRKFFWFPLFGHQELGLRLPSLAASFLTVFLCSFLAWHQFGRKRSSVGLAAAAFLGAWVSFHSIEQHYATEARHYSFLALISLVWFWSYFRLQRPVGLVVFTFTSLAYLNTHFFAFPIVGAAWGIEVLREVLRKNFRSGAYLAVLGAAIVGGSLWLNFPAFNSMLDSPSVQAAPSLRPTLWNAAKAAGRDLDGFFTYSEAPIFPFGVWAFLLLGLWARSKTRWQNQAVIRWMVAVFLLLPALFLRIRLTSDYSFHARYFSPFFGLVFFTFLLALDALDSLFQRAAIALPLLLFSGAIWLQATHQRGQGFALPSQNYTAMFGFMESLKSKGPLLVVASPCWGAEVPRLYWNFIGAKIGASADFLENLPYHQCVEPSLARESLARKRIEHFLARHGTATLIFYDMDLDQSCGGFSGAGAQPRLALPRGVDLFQDQGKCLFTKMGVRSADEAIHLATALGFPRSKPGLMRRNFD
jgi:hypothetical protein